MKKILFIAGMLLSATLSMQAQDLDVDKKTGLVQVDGKDAFYLTPKNKQFLESDFSLENLQHKELAYLKYTKYGNNSSYYMVFTKSGNQCSLYGINPLNSMKQIAKNVAGANLVQDNAVSEEEERKFIILHNGRFIKDPALSTPPPPTERVIAPVESKQVSTGPADISIKENKIYNNSEMVGVFKRASESGITTVSVYNSNDAMVCKATHTDGNDNADWNLLLDGKTVTLLYNSGAPLEKLFKYLAEKGYL